MSETKMCNLCNLVKPANEEFFGHTPNGNLKNQCRVCKRKYAKEYGAAKKAEQAARNILRAERGGHFSLNEQQKMALYSYQKGLCLCCGGKLDSYKKTEVDHGIPIVQGGANEIGNLYLAHPSCNQAKHGKTLEEHWARRELIGNQIPNKTLLMQIMARLQEIKQL